MTLISQLGRIAARGTIKTAAPSILALIARDAQLRKNREPAQQPQNKPYPTSGGSYARPTQPKQQRLTRTPNVQIPGPNILDPPDPYQEGTSAWYKREEMERAIPSHAPIPNITTPNFSRTPAMYDRDRSTIMNSDLLKSISPSSQSEPFKL